MESLPLPRFVGIIVKETVDLLLPRRCIPVETLGQFACRVTEFILETKL